MANLSLKVTGVDEVAKMFKAYGREGNKIFAEVTKIKAKEIAAEAKRLAPYDLGKLRQSIIDERVAKLTYTVTAYAPYAAYMEFGTGTKVDIPSEFRGIASGFIGKGIKQINLYPRPYMYPAFIIGRKTYLKDLKNELGKLNKKYNG